jgi:hypothetical protein
VAQAELINIEWPAGGRFERSVNLAPGKFAEVCGTLDEGQTIHWSFEAQEALNFNIHYHLGKEVIYPARQNQVRQARGELPVEVKQDYCWMWVNKSPRTVRLTLALTRP